MHPTNPADEQNPPDTLGHLITSIIRVEGLAKRYRRRKTTPRAVDGVSFQVKQGEIFGLIGPDGAGKTSVIQMLAGVLKVTDGTASVAGVDVVERPEDVKPLIGYMPQGLGLNLYDSLTVEENIAFFRDLRQVPEAQFRENRDRLLHMTRLAPFLNRPAGHLSGGMRQKLALICTLIHLPDVLFLDEPTTGVDPVSRRDFWTIIHDLVAMRRVTVLLTTSYMDEAERCHGVGLMHEGKIIAQGTPDELISNFPLRVARIRAQEPERLVSALNEWRGAENVALFGKDVLVLLRGKAADLYDRIRLQNFGDVDITFPPPGLEDVFVHDMARTADGRVMADVGAPSNGLDRINAALDGAAFRQNHVPDGPPIQARELTCCFDGFTAVSNIDLSVAKGEILGLLGPNGAGKTTLIRMLCGIQQPSEGSATVAGFSVTAASYDLRNSIGYMSQRFSLYRDLTVKANLRLYAGLYGLSKRAAKDRIEQLLVGLDLVRFANRSTAALPLGIRQRLALAAAMIHAPPILFLDEPTSGVDPIARRQFWDIVHLLAQRERTTVLVSTHYMDEAEHCDRLGLMRRGHLVALASPDELKQRAQEHGGPLVVVRTDDFASAYEVLRRAFPTAMLYGRRIQWQSLDPQGDIATAKEILVSAKLAGELTEQPLTIEETFIYYVEAGGCENV